MSTAPELEQRRGGQQPENTRRRAFISTVLLTALLLTIPPWLFWLTPVLLLGYRESWRLGALALGVSWILCLSGAALTPLLVAQMGGPGGIIFMMMCSVSGLVLLWGAAQNRSLSLTGGVAVGLWAAVAGLGLIAVLQTSGDEVRSSWQQRVVGPMDTWLSDLQSDGRIEDRAVDEAEVWRQLLRERPQWLLYLMPGALSALVGFLLFINFWLVKGLESGFGGPRPLSEWRPPDAWFWALVAAMAAMLTGQTALVAVAANGVILLAGAYLLSGMGLASFAARRWGAPSWLVVGLTTLMVLSGGMPLFIAIGVLDFWLDFRTRWKKADGS